MEFGDKTPFGDPSWYQGFHSPYFQEKHLRWRSALRAFVEENILPHVHEWDEARTLPKSLWAKAYQAGWLPCVVGSPWPAAVVGPSAPVAGGLRPEEVDYFCEMIAIDEVARCGSSGVLLALFGGLTFGLPPVLNYAHPDVKQKIARECLTGEKAICLAITEPTAGSDVANIRTSAVKSADGKHYIVNGEKKWITNGVFADYFTVAVRTGSEPGMAGISLLLLHRGMPGLSTRQMLCTGGWASGTAYVTMEDVKVPVENLIGQEGSGFKYIMTNFNHERWSLIIQANRFSRVCLEEALKYAHKRETFGKKLIDHPVIRMKIANMTRHIEATQSWLENVTFQLTKQPPKVALANLGGPIALLKLQATQTFELCVREAQQIFGGLGYTRGGQGEKVERLSREIRAYSIAGGSEEIMADLGVRQALAKAKL